MTLLYGYSLLYVLAGIFAYSLNALQVFVIAMICFVVDRFVFKSYRRFFTILITSVVIIGVGVYLLYRYDYLLLVWAEILDFLLVYYYSVSVTTVSIGAFHQMVALVAIGLMMLAPLDLLIRRNKDNSLYLLVGTSVLIVAGYLTRTMGSMKDREAFLILSSTMIVYYFYSFYHRHTDYRRKFLPFISTVMVFILVIVAGSRMLYSYDPRPLTQEKRQSAFVLSDDIEMQTQEPDKMNYFRRDTFEVADSFEFDYIEIMRLVSEDVDYLKAETFELYRNGVWNKAEDLAYSDEESQGIHTSELVDPVAYRDYYTLERVRSVISNFNSNAVLMNNYASIDTAFPGTLRVMNDVRRGTFYSDSPMETGYAFEYQAVVPNYGSRALDDLIRANSNNRVPFQLSVYSEPLRDNYRAVAELAADVTEGIDNKYDQALAIEQYLKTNYSYNETPPIPPEGVDPVLYFLFESGEGFCQQFATAHVLMMRSLDIPARYAAGFYVSGRNLDPEEYGELIYEQGLMDEGVYSVYDSNAHTWPEAWFPEVGWIMLEPTPGRTYKVEQEDYNPYDFELSEQEETPGVLEVVDIRYAWLTGVIIILVGLIFVLWTIRSKRHELAVKTPTEKMLAIHWMVRRYLRSVGLVKQPSETAREFAIKADDYFYEDVETSIEDLMDDYEGFIYGGESIDEEDLEDHIRLYGEVKDALKNRLNRFQKMAIGLSAFRRINLKKK